MHSIDTDVSPENISVAIFYSRESKIFSINVYSSSVTPEMTGCVQPLVCNSRIEHGSNHFFLPSLHYFHTHMLHLYWLVHCPSSLFINGAWVIFFINCP